MTSSVQQKTIYRQKHMRGSAIPPINTDVLSSVSLVGTGTWVEGGLLQKSGPSVGPLSMTMATTRLMRPARGVPAKHRSKSSTPAADLANISTAPHSNLLTLGYIQQQNAVQIRYHTVDGRNPASSKNPGMMIRLQVPDEQWFRLASRWCRISSIHSINSVYTLKCFP